MTDKSWDGPASLSLVRERALTTALSVEGCYSEHSSVSRRAELLGWSVKAEEGLRGRCWPDQR